ncbi:MAG: type I-MYXAN CRISPR-associated protein Cas6/Cmx6 [Holophaga sp.]|nr:type I-MYXAN CRISPR-associated protein Cas6/Cmx6 [Holophaga sp.]
MNKDPIDPGHARLPLEPLNPVLDLCFPIDQGRNLEVDHGHALYLALREACPSLERIPGLGIHAVRGVPGGRRGELILPDESEVRLRIPAGSAPLLKGLAGAELAVEGHPIRLGEPHAHALAPVSALWARTVTIHFRDPALGSAQAQLAFRLAQDFPWGSFRILRPRTIRFEGRQLLGFELAVRNLTPQASLRLQGQGFGGRRALGCGLFVPFAASSRSKAS